MKKAFLFTALLYSSILYAQLKPTSVCPEFVIDILDGRIGELDPRSTIGQIKAKYPCIPIWKMNRTLPFVEVEYFIKTGIFTSIPAGIM